MSHPPTGRLMRATAPGESCRGPIHERRHTPLAARRRPARPRRRPRPPQSRLRGWACAGTIKKVYSLRSLMIGGRNGCWICRAPRSRHTYHHCGTRGFTMSVGQDTPVPRPTAAPRRVRKPPLSEERAGRLCKIDRRARLPTHPPTGGENTLSSRVCTLFLARGLDPRSAPAARQRAPSATPFSLSSAALHAAPSATRRVRSPPSQCVRDSFPRARDF